MPHSIEQMFEQQDVASPAAEWFGAADQIDGDCAPPPRVGRLPSLLGFLINRRFDDLATPAPGGE
jgi:hypothetical protein